MPTNLQARFSTVEQQHTAEELGFGPIAHHIQQAEWILLELFVVCMIKIDVKLTSLVGGKIGFS